MTDLHDLAGAFALEALDDLERQRFERHLAGCAICRQEVEAMREALGRLAFEAIVEAPAAMRARVLSEVEVRPQVRSQNRWFQIASLVAAALAVVVAAGLYVTSDGRQIAAIRGAEDAVTVVAQTTDGFTAEVIWSEQRGMGVLAVDGLGDLPSEQDYEVWVIGTDAPNPAGVFDPRGR